MGTSRAASACKGRGGDFREGGPALWGGTRGVEAGNARPFPVPLPTRPFSGSEVRGAPAASQVDPSPCFSPALAPASRRAAQRLGVGRG